MQNQSSATTSASNLILAHINRDIIYWHYTAIFLYGIAYYHYNNLLFVKTGFRFHHTFTTQRQQFIVCEDGISVSPYIYNAKATTTNLTSSESTQILSHGLKYQNTD